MSQHQENTENELFYSNMFLIGCGFFFNWLWLFFNLFLIVVTCLFIRQIWKLFLLYATGSQFTFMIMFMFLPYAIKCQ